MAFSSKDNSYGLFLFIKENTCGAFEYYVSLSYEWRLLEFFFEKQNFILQIRLIRLIGQ